MKFFIDTADLSQIKEANELGILDGVTTNPSLMAKVGIKGTDAIMQHYKTICELVDGDIMFHVHLAEDGKEFQRLAAELRTRSKQERKIVFWAVSLNDAIDLCS